MNILFTGTEEIVNAIDQNLLMTVLTDLSISDKAKSMFDVYSYHGDAQPGYRILEELRSVQTIKLHSAIIIEDSDEVERKVLQEILDKRRDFLKLSTKT